MIAFSIILPAHNESSLIERNVVLVDEFMQKLGASYEIIIAEDGSTDKTYLIARDLAERKPNIKVIHSEQRLGKGAALTRAVAGSEGQIIAFMDADLSVDLNKLSELLKFVQETSEVVIGSRLVKGSSTTRPPLRGFTSIAYNTCINILFRDGIHDHQCGFKGFQRGVAEEVLLQMRSTGWVWDTEFVLRVIKAGYSVHEMPVSWHERKGKTSLKALFLAPTMLFELLDLWVHEPSLSLSLRYI